MSCTTTSQRSSSRGRNGVDAGASRGVVDARAVAEGGFELEELAERPRDRADEREAAIARIVDVGEEREHLAEVLRARGVDELPRIGELHPGDADGDRVLGDRLVGTDVERESLEDVVEIGEVRAGDLGDELARVRIDRVPLRLRALLDPTGEAPTIHRRAVDEEAGLLRERHQLASPVELLGDEDHAGGVDRSLRVLREAIERGQRLDVYLLARAFLGGARVPALEAAHDDDAPLRHHRHGARCGEDLVDRRLAGGELVEVQLGEAAGERGLRDRGKRLITKEPLLAGEEPDGEEVAALGALDRLVGRHRVRRSDATSDDARPRCRVRARARGRAARSRDRRTRSSDRGRRPRSRSPSGCGS